MDGTTSYRLLTDAIGGVPAALIIRCAKGVPEVYIHVADYVQPELGGGHTIRLKFDALTARIESWEQSTDSKSLFSLFPSLMLYRMIKSKRMLFEFTPYEKPKRLITFNVSGLETALKPMAGSCGYPDRKDDFLPTDPFPELDP